MPAPAASPSPVAIAAGVATMCGVWGSTWLVIKVGNAELPPFTAAAARFTVAGLVMAALAPVLARREGGRRPGPGLVAVMGVLQFAVSYAIVYWTETVLPSGLTAVLWAAYPLLLSVFGHVLLPSERMVGRQWLGMVLGFFGIACLFWNDLRAAGAEHLGAGAVLMVSPLVVAIANALIRRHGREVSSVLLNRDGMLLGAALLVGLAVVAEADAEYAWTGSALFTVAYLALAGTCLTFSIYFWLLRHLPAYKLALTAYVSPLVALALGIAVAGESYTVETAVGTGLVLLGVAAARRRPARLLRRG